MNMVGGGNNVGVGSSIMGGGNLISNDGVTPPHISLDTRMVNLIILW